MSTPPKVKICGITSLADAELSLELGAWAIGMIFYRDSPRRCSAEEAQVIAAALRRRVELCGVFVNAPLVRIVKTAEDLELSLLQLHGDEGPSFCSEVARRTGARVIKAIQVSSEGELRDSERFHTDYHLLDARSDDPARRALRGGTGTTLDWKMLAARRSHTPLILSGGLTPGNVGEAIAATHPFALDSASGTESSPGRKDRAKLEAFFDAAGHSTSPVGSAG